MELMIITVSSIRKTKLIKINKKHFKQVNIQWNPVNMVTQRPWKVDHINGVESDFMTGLYVLS